MVYLLSVKRDRLLALGAVLLLSIGIRIYFWRDLGTLSWDGGAHSLGGVLLARTLLHLFDSPLQYAQAFVSNYWPTVGSLFFYPYGYDLLTAISYLLFGFNDFAARVPNMVASILIFHPIYMISQYIYNEKTGYAAAIFGAVTPYFISWGGRAAVDVPMVFLTTYAIYYLLKATDTGNWRAWLIGGFLLGCASLFKPTAIILGAPLFGTAVLLDRTYIRNKWYYLGGIVGLLTFSTYILTGILAQLLFPIIGDLAMRNVLHWFSSALTYAEATDPTWRTVNGWTYYPQLIPRQFGWVITSLSISGIAYKISDWELEDSERLLLVTIAFVYLLHVFLSNKDPRYVMLYAPLFCVFAGTAAVSGAESIGNHLSRDGIAVRSTLAVLFTLSVVTSGIALMGSNNPQYPDSGIRDASEIATSSEPGLVVVHGQRDSVSVNAIAFYVAINDPDIEYSVYWYDRVDKSRWIISSTSLSREGWTLHSTIERDQTIYLYNRTH